MLYRSTKAFDSLWRTGLLYKFGKLGIGNNMFNVIIKINLKIL